MDITGIGERLVFGDGVVALGLGFGVKMRVRLGKVVV